MCLKPIYPNTDKGNECSILNCYRMGMGSVTVAAWIAHATFWFLLVYGWAVDEIHAVALAVFITLWVIARFGLPYLDAAAFFTPSIAILDIVLVFLIFKGDVRLR